LSAHRVRLGGTRRQDERREKIGQLLFTTITEAFKDTTGGLGKSWPDVTDLQWRVLKSTQGSRGNREGQAIPRRLLNNKLQAKSKRAAAGRRGFRARHGRCGWMRARLSFPTAMAVAPGGNQKRVCDGQDNRARGALRVGIHWIYARTRMYTINLESILKHAIVGEDPERVATICDRSSFAA